MYLYKPIHSAILIISALVIFPPQFCLGQNQPTQAEDIRKTISTTMAIEQKKQKVETGWADEQTELKEKLTNLEQVKAELSTRLNRLERLLDLEQKREAENLRKKAATSRIENELSIYLESVLGSLEELIKADLPFLTEERHARLESLKTLLIDPAESPAEKFRRVFEALQIEAEYGSTIEALQTSINLDGKQTLVDMFRLGRVSMFFLTMDRQKAGYFDPAAKKWKSLPKSAINDMESAIAMARLERTVDLIKLHLGRIVKP